MVSKLREPNNVESNDCVKLLYISGPNLLTYLFIEREPKIYEILHFFYKNPGLFSKDNIIVEEENNNIRGLFAIWCG